MEPMQRGRGKRKKHSDDGERPSETGNDRVERRICVKWDGKTAIFRWR
jgi:hypothetical protein